MNIKGLIIVIVMLFSIKNLLYANDISYNNYQSNNILNERDANVNDQCCFPIKRSDTPMTNCFVGGVGLGLLSLINFFIGIHFTNFGFYTSLLYLESKDDNNKEGIFTGVRSNLFYIFYASGNLINAISLSSGGIYYYNSHNKWGPVYSGVTFIMIWRGFLLEVGPSYVYNYSHTPIITNHWTCDVRIGILKRIPFR